ncbi:argonaute family protein [Striga asiatica]|uniref:Argonaute family protein n=1 Tax=Striga asiatica TaxID=4170 RepID=A0A5A7RA73_STRAF|nr:argonaute family protein [Striga asiatica]
MGREILDLSAEIGDIRLTFCIMVLDKQTYRDVGNRGMCRGIRGGRGGRDPGGASRRRSPQPPSGDEDGEDTISEVFVEGDDRGDDKGTHQEATFAGGYRARHDWGLDCEYGQWEGPFRVDIPDLDGEQHDRPLYDGPPIFDEEPQGPGEELDVKYFAYDGEKSLFTVTLLPHNKLEFTFVLDSVTSNIILRQHGTNQGCLLVRPSFFHNDPHNFADVGGRVLGGRGFHSSLNINVSTTIIIQPGPVDDFLVANQNVTDPFSVDWAKARVETSPTYQEHKITELREKSCRDQTFTLKETSGYSCHEDVSNGDGSDSRANPAQPGENGVE